ncbi:MAG: nuclear transport factor 2 family protein [Nitrosospira sp.]|nr:nuclear transport factor 2 family protein [Nitrosospira sp.]
MTTEYSESELAMVNLLEKHVNAELQGDLDTTMATMSEDPHLFNIPTMMGGNGYDGVRSFYKDHLVGKFFPPDVTMNRVSLTVGTNQIVEELVIGFTHTATIDWLLPGIEPTGKRVEIGVVVIAGVKDKKLTHEHIYWDQASVLVQVGLLDSNGLPVCGAESAQKLLNPTMPNRTLNQPPGNR